MYKNQILNLTNVVGTFQTNDNLLSSSSDESDGLVKTTGNATLTLAGGVNQRTFDEVKQVFMDGGWCF